MCDFETNCTKISVSKDSNFILKFNTTRNGNSLRFSYDESFNTRGPCISNSQNCIHYFTIHSTSTLRICDLKTYDFTRIAMHILLCFQSLCVQSSLNDWQHWQRLTNMLSWQIIIHRNSTKLQRLIVPPVLISIDVKELHISFSGNLHKIITEIRSHFRKG